MPEPETDQPHVREVEAVYRGNLRTMTPAQRLDAAMDMYWVAQEQKTSAVKRQHPDWTESQVRQAVREAFLYARD